MVIWRMNTGKVKIFNYGITNHDYTGLVNTYTKQTLQKVSFISVVFGGWDLKPI